jgi:DNA/RNA endonuclease G (NUC1)
VTWLEVENALVASATKENPVMYVAATGLTAILPVMADGGTVEIPLAARIT